jgi:hypothetical protein
MKKPDQREESSQICERTRAILQGVKQTKINTGKKKKK